MTRCRERLILGRDVGVEYWEECSEFCKVEGGRVSMMLKSAIVNHNRDILTHPKCGISKLCDRGAMSSF